MSGLQFLGLLFLCEIVGTGYALVGISSACDRDAPLRVLVSRWLLLLVWLGLLALTAWTATLLD